MNLFVRKILLLFIFSLLCIAAQSQANVSLSVSPSHIGKDGYAIVKIVVENAGDIQQLNPPSLKDFMLLGGPDQESWSTTFNGHVSNYAAFSFTIKPRHTGKFNISAAEIKIAGKIYKTNSATLVVDKNAAPNNTVTITQSPPIASFDPYAANRSQAEFNDYIFHKGDNVADKVDKNMILKLEVDKTSCYVGEPIVATYKLYTRLKSESKLSENPSFNGFSVIDLTQPDVTNYTKGKLNGREYNVYIIRKAQLYPLQEGNIDLEAAELENNIQFIKAEYINRRPNDINGLLDDFTQAMVPPEAIINQSVTLRNKPVTITVKALPESNKPASFTGAVGKFMLEAALQKTSFPGNEPGKLIVKIGGEGNLQLLTAPVLSWPAGIDVYEPKVAEDISKISVPVSGFKTFEYDFAVDKPGTYSLPAISFSYFDPGTHAYKTINTKEFPFTVTKATGPSLVPTMQVKNVQSVTGINRIFNNRWWIIVFILLAVITGILIWLIKEKSAAKKIVGKQPMQEDLLLNSIVETAAINQQNPLLKTEACLYQGDCMDFYSLLNTELKTYLGNKFKVEPMNIHTRSIAAIMDKKNISNETVLRLQQLLQQIEWQLYTPFERNERMNAMYQETQDVIQLINSYDFRHL
jgi:BatD DUF11 like domain